MFNLLNLGSLLLKNSTSYIASFFSVLYSLFGRHVVNFFLNVFSVIWNLVTKYVWFVTKCVLAIMDAMQFAIMRFIGIDTTNKTATTLGEYIEGMKNIRSGNTNYYNMIMDVFKALAVVGIILMIVFTIVAMVIQEYKLASEGYSKGENGKGKFIKVLFKNIITITLMPLIFYTIIVGTNSILVSFYTAIGNSSNVTIAGQVLASATYDANRYRSYADNNKRVPITISVYEMENAFGKTLSDEELQESIEDEETQNILKAIGGAFSNDSFLSFEKSTIYSNGKWQSYNNYSLSYNNTEYDNLGQYFENFVCTREQYYVLADFIDFCQLYNVNYYIKSITESDICWKYVDNISGDIDDDGNALGDVTLTIKYRDAEVVNAPVDSVDATSGDSDEIHEMQISTKLDMTSPISDAMTTASTLLGIDETSAKFYAMERDEDSTNIVSWETEKVLLKLSNSFDITKSNEWTRSDEIIIYEYYHLDTNNTLGDYTISELKETGAKLDARVMTYRNFNSYTQTYSSEHEQPCVYLNGNYYRIEKSENPNEVDDYGNPYYVLSVLDSGTSYYKNGVISIKEIGSKKLKLSDHFNINSLYNEVDGILTWNGSSQDQFQDQILVYEYFKDLSLSNGLRRTNKFTDFSTGDGVEFKIYQIGGSDYYLYINGTYYQCNATGDLLQGTGVTNFLVNASNKKSWFGYNLTLTNENKQQYGMEWFSTPSRLYSKIDILNYADQAAFISALTHYASVDSSDIFYAKYSQINMKFSKNFSYSDTTTWTFRDYAIMYLYLNELNGKTTATLDTLKIIGLQGDIVKWSDDNKYYYKIQLNDGNYLFIDLDTLEKISELNISKTFSTEMFENLGLDYVATDLLIDYSSSSDILLADNTSSRNVESHLFELSENFDQMDATTWTVGDYLFMYLIKIGVLDISLEQIELSGYEALIYTSEEGAKYYKFGIKGDENSYYIDGSKLTNKGYDIDRWFKTKLMTYINLELGSIISEGDSFENSAIGNPNSYVYDLDTESINSLAEKLVEDILDVILIGNDADVLKYSYYNQNAKANDPTTWNYIDTYIYFKTGSIPTSTKPYVTYLSKSGSDLYLVVDDKMLNITEVNSKYECLKHNTDLVTTRIISRGEQTFESEDNFRSYFNNYFSALFLNATTYNSKGTATSLGYFGYKSQYLINEGSTASYANVPTCSSFDMFLIKAGITQTNGYYTFEASKIGSYVYVKVSESYYVLISSNNSNYFYYQENLLTCVGDFAFSIEVDNDKYTSFGATINQYDALLYSILGSTASVTYTKYKFNSSDYYIQVGDNYIKFDLTLANATAAIPTNNDAKLCKFLYDNYYYEKFVSEDETSLAEYKVNEYSINLCDETNNADTTFTLNTYSTWTGLKVILYKLMEDNSSINSVLTAETTSIIKIAGNKYALKFNNGTKDYYVHLDNLVDVSISGDIITLTDKTRNDLTYKLYNAKYDSEIFTARTQTKLTVNEVSFDDTCIDIPSTSVTTDISTTSIANWTYYDLVFNYFEADKYSLYYYNNKEYLILSMYGEDYIIKNEITSGVYITDSANKIFNIGTKVTDTLDGTSLEVILTNKSYKTSSDIYKYNAKQLKGSDDQKLIVYIFQDTSDEYHAIYDLLNATDTGTGVAYLGPILDGKYNQSGTTTEGDASIFTLEPKSIDAMKDWTIVDYTISYLTGESFLKSYVYINDSNYYIKVGSEENANYIKLIFSDFDSVFNYQTSTEGKINLSAFSTIFDSVFAASEKQYLFKYGALETNDSRKITIDNYNSETLHAGAGSLDLARFSDTFDISDYSTWTYSDYIIYYAFTKEDKRYGQGNFSYEFKYAYTPEYSVNGSTYYDLTYFDFMLIKYYGMITANDNIYLYINDNKQSKVNYKFTLVKSTDNKYYIELKKDELYLEITDTNTEDFYFSAGKLYSKFLDETITIKQGADSDGISTKYSEIESTLTFETSISKHTSFEQIELSYTPQFIKEGYDYSQLTYLDIILANFYGKMTESDKKYKYFYDTQDSYEFYVVNKTGTDEYYIKLGDEFHVIISDDISINFSNLSIDSDSLGVIFKITDEKDEIAGELALLTEYYTTTEMTTVENENEIEDEEEIYTIIYKTSFNGTNFQTFVNSGGAPIYSHYLLSEDDKTGSVKYNKVVDFADNDGRGFGTFFKYNKFFSFSTKLLSSKCETTDRCQFDITISESEPAGASLKMEITYDEIFSDLTFDNYFYYSIDINKINDLSLNNVNSELQKKIINGDMEDSSKKSLNLRLSNSCNLSDLNTWTVLDYVILYEYSRDVRHNKFENMTIDELKSTDYPTEVYYYATSGSVTSEYVILYINGNFYNLKIDDHVTYDNINKIYNNENGALVDRGTISAGTVSSYSFKVLKETLEFSINPLYSNSKQFIHTKNNTLFKNGTTLYYGEINTDIADKNFRINTSKFATYSTEIKIKTVSWVEKLMTDMQVYYPTLNWSTLIATDGWLDNLGDFMSAYTSGLYIAEGNSTNTTAAGLVLSEFFMSVATEVEDSYADYEYSSMFDEETIHALMLSLVGEQDYNGLVLEAKVFMDYFNSCFAPVIDDFAEEFGESIGENSLRLCAYKSYLATLLLSSDIGEYLYTIATRVYAEYTIGEYLAAASGDYAGYYNYTNNILDEDGNTVDSYNYGSFADLVKYENAYCGKSTPTFTFNFDKAFDYFAEKQHDEGETSQEGVVKVSTSWLSSTEYTKTEVKEDTEKYNIVVYAFVDWLNEEYESLYMSGKTISEKGKVLNSEGIEVTSEKGKIYPYCYMLNVYWSIKYSIKQTGGGDDPVYLENYYDYLTNDLRRWDILCSETIDSVDQYFEKYSTYRSRMKVYKTLTLANAIRLFIPTNPLNGDDAKLKLLDFLQTFKEFLKDPIKTLASETIIPIANAVDIMGGNGQSTKEDINFVLKGCFGIYFAMTYSEESTVSFLDTIKDLIGDILEKVGIDTDVTKSWDYVLKFKTCLDNVVSELEQVLELLPGESTDNGSTRKKNAVSDRLGEDLYYEDSELSYILNAFQSLSQCVTQYVAAQTTLDKIQKRSITFTLAQYGSNYVSSGYEFTIKNRTYTFKNNIDPSRIAEYVYGGAFLESVGVGAQYTSSDFTGMVKATKVYDPVDKVIKKELISWKELRTFVTEIADVTAELYYMTNLSDLDVSKVNGIKLTDHVLVLKSDGTDEITLAEMILNYLTETNCQFSVELKNRLVTSPPTGESEEDRKTRIYNNFVAVSQYIFSYEVDDSAYNDMTFEEYKRIALKKIIDNDQNSEESPEERAGRYMSVFNVLSLQFDFDIYVGDNKIALGRIIPQSNVIRSADNSLKYKENVALFCGDDSDPAEVENYDAESVFLIYANLSSSYNTQEIIKTLSGLENRPTREILTREYSGLRSGDYFDEAYGDSFIVCTYKNGLYYPVIATGSKAYTSTKYQNYINNILQKDKFVTQYYDSGAYVVMAKGIITADGYPTAIRKYNNAITISQKKLLSSTTTTYNSVTFYRTNIGSNFGEGNDLISASRAVSRVTTKNYTKYIYGTSFTTGIGSTTTYTGKTNLKTLIESDYETHFIQSKCEYLIGQSDEYGGIDVIEEFSYFYLFGGQSWVLLMLAFVTLIPILINFLGGAMKRVLDLTLLYMISPVVISTNSLYPDGNNNSYINWKKNLESDLFCVLGYVIGLSSYFILVSAVFNMNVFVSASTYNSIIKIGGVVSRFSYLKINSLMRCLWVLTAVSIIDKIPKLLMPIITANRGDMKDAHPLSGDGKPYVFTQRAKAVVGDIEKMIAKAGSIVSGKALIGLKDMAIDAVKESIPGFELLRGISDKAQGKAIQVALQLVSEYYGAPLSKSQAKAAADAMMAAKKKKRDAKQKDRDEYKKAAKNLFS